MSHYHFHHLTLLLQHAQSTNLLDSARSENKLYQFCPCAPRIMDPLSMILGIVESRILPPSHTSLYVVGGIAEWVVFSYAGLGRQTFHILL